MSENARRTHYSLAWSKAVFQQSAWKTFDGNVYAYDVNTNTNYNSDAEAKAGRYGMLELATFLGDALHVTTTK